MATDYYTSLFSADLATKEVLIVRETVWSHICLVRISDVSVTLMSPFSKHGLFCQVFVKPKILWQTKYPISTPGCGNVF